MDIALIIEWLIKSVVLLLIGLTGFAYTTLYERRALARIQTRIGPNRAGPEGILQPVADGIKLIFKEELIPDQADKILFVLAPVITVLPALIIWAVIPWGDTVMILGREVSLVLADINVGILYLMAVASIAVYGIVIAGWSSNSKYPLLGGLRSTAQMISYELSLGLAFVVPILIAGAVNVADIDPMSLVDIVRAQRETWWFVFYQPLGFAILMIAGLAEVNRAPFDMPEAEQELVGGYHTEYSGMKFALFFMAEYIKMIAVSAIGATLFLGGYDGPFVGRFPWLGPLYLLIKIAILLFWMIWMRGTLPRFRYDRLMAFGWKILLPLAIVNVFLTAVVIVLL
ncbi:MAG: NADH-quinone oxidoreductase subunit NuoH [Anaerolineales bacterium]